jgi:hypothetical protein
VRREVAEAILNHAPPGIESTYNYAVYGEEKRLALQGWADYLDTIVTGDDRKVVPMRPKGGFGIIQE